MSHSPGQKMLEKRKEHQDEEAPRASNSSTSSNSSVERTGPQHDSAKSTASKWNPLNFQMDPKSSIESTDPQQVSAKSDASKWNPLNFQTNQKSLKKTVESTDPSDISLASNSSMDSPMTFRLRSKRQKNPVCCVCENAFTEKSVSFTCGHVACISCVIPNRDESDSPQHYCTKCGTHRKVAPNQALILEITDRQTLNTIKKHKKVMHSKYSVISEGNGDRSPVNLVYTSLSTNFWKSDLPQEHYIKHLTRKDSQSPDKEVNVSEIFESFTKTLPRTILTNGVAGIGKSFSVQKFIVDWADDKANTNINFIFCLSFREMNLYKENISFLQLLKDFHPALHDTNSEDFVKTNIIIIIILDGLDESRFSLDFRNSPRVTSVEEVESVSSLVTNLIQGNLLPSAQVWITSRPAASQQIPGELIHRVTEIQGFNDRQKEEYFNKRFSLKPDVAKTVIHHIQSSQTLDLLCQIPIFCWISAVLFEEVFAEETTEAPQTLTEMMAHFLFVQTKRSSRKYDTNPEKERVKLLDSKREFLLKLGELAFVHLLKNSLIFYEDDLKQCGLDPQEATVNSGFFNTLFREEELFSQKKVYSFVHLTIQEFFAAVYVYDCFTKNKTWAPDLINFLDLQHSAQSPTPPLYDLLKTAVDKVLQKNGGHLAFFIRFLLGLVVDSNQRLLHGLLVTADSSQDTVKKMLLHLKALKALRRKTISPDACIILFQMMVEMGDTKISEEIEEYLKSRDRSRIDLTPLHCSALAFTIQVSKSKLQELDLKSYNTSEEGRRRLIPAIRNSKKANLSDCRLTPEMVSYLSMALTFTHSSLRDLDLSNNDLRDSGVKQLCEGLQSPACKLKILRLSGCLVTEEGCASLVSALKSNPSHLKELDLSYNHLSDGETALTELRADQQYNLSQINVSNGGSCRMIPGLKKYSCDLTWDVEKAPKGVQFSDDHREVSRSEEGPEQGLLVLCGQELKERCYWEINATNSFTIGVTYADMGQKEFRLGQNDTSWGFVCSNEGCSVLHKNKSEPIISSYSSRSRRLAVYLDQPGGVLSFYRVSTDTCLYTFRQEFPQTLVPAVELHQKSSASFIRAQQQ